MHVVFDQMLKVVLVAVEIDVDAISLQQRLHPLDHSRRLAMIAARQNRVVADHDLPPRLIRRERFLEPLQLRARFA